MSQISVNNLTFSYEGSPDAVFENVSFTVDTSWKLGFAGRNGKGKTTFLRLLMGEYPYSGTIACSTRFDYFPYRTGLEETGRSGAELAEQWKPGCEQWRILCEMDQLGLDAEILYRPFETLSFGERTKIMLAVLFSGENDFLLIDEPTNHLDQDARESVKAYLSGKKGFILVSHERDLLDACADHMLVLNRRSIEVQSGNFSSWEENKRRKDDFARKENEKHLKEIGKLKKAAEKTTRWAEKNEGAKIGFDPVREHDRSIATRSYIGAKTKKMNSRVRQMQGRIQREIREKEGLLQDIESVENLKIMPLEHHKKTLVRAEQLALRYEGAGECIFENLNFELCQGERLFLRGANGCGKSSLLKMILRQAGYENRRNEKGNRLCVESGSLYTAPGLVISYVSQDTSFLKGSVFEFCREKDLDESLFCAVLRKLDVDRNQFGKNMEEYSEGQKKKILIAAGLLTPAHLYIWDEPLNYIDIFSRMQIEQLLLRCRPTMLAVDHDLRFQERVATDFADIGES